MNISLHSRLFPLLFFHLCLHLVFITLTCVQCMASLAFLYIYSLLLRFLTFQLCKILLYSFAVLSLSVPSYLVLYISSDTVSWQKKHGQKSNKNHCFSVLFEYWAFRKSWIIPSFLIKLNIPLATFALPG